MKKMSLAIPMVMVSSLLVTSVGANAVPKPQTYAKCATLLEIYPSGVAKTAAAARVSVADGNQKPAVSKKVYDLNGKRLDRDGDLVVCEQVAKSEAPVVVPATPVVTYVLTGISIYDALNQGKADSGLISQAQSNALTRFGAAVSSPTQNARVKICPLFPFEIFRTGYLNSAITPEVLSALSLTLEDTVWAKENLGLATETYCAQFG
jgi:hypothetical protein